MRIRKALASFGFTLIELLVATMVAMLLMIAILGVIGSFSAKRRPALELRSKMYWQQNLIEWLHRDLVNSRRIEVEDEKITLIGYNGMDLATGIPNYLHAEVRYYLQEIGGRKWLLRRQANLHDLTNQNVRIDLVCSGIGGLAVLEVDEGEERPLEGMVPIPERIKLVVRFADPSMPSLDRILCLK